jgi:cbb3-type cytochrome oxidase cytochrome c subunit
MIYVYSTLSCNQLYTKYVKSAGGDMSRLEKSVLIKGGANVADKHFITPRGVVTEVSAADYEFLKENKLFKLHVANGYVTTDAKNVNIEKVVTDMTGADKSAPLTPEDYQVESKTPPVSNKKK